MTREEAIKSLESQRDCIILSCQGACHEGKECDECDFMYAKGTMGEMRDAYDVAIKALQEQKVGKWVMHREDIVYTNGYLTKKEWCVPNAVAKHSLIPRPDLKRHHTVRIAERK